MELMEKAVRQLSESYYRELDEWLSNIIRQRIGDFSPQELRGRLVRAEIRPTRMEHWYLDGVLIAICKPTEFGYENGRISITQERAP